MRRHERPPGFWPPLIEEALRSSGGGAPPRQVCVWLEQHVTLTDRERSASTHGQRPRLQVTVQGIMNEMAHPSRGRLLHPWRGWYVLPSWR